MFSDSEHASPLPDLFFRRLLKEISSVEELKVTLYVLWRLGHMEGKFRALAETDLDARDVGLPIDEMHLGLDAAEKRGSLLKGWHEGKLAYFLNSPEGQAAAKSYEKSGWPGTDKISSLPLERPNVFRLYEENIGPLTPLIADALIDAEGVYTAQWVADAIDLAVKHNKRSWKYAEAILKRWKEEGRAEKQIGRDDQASRQHDVEDKIKKFVGRTG